MLFYRLSYEMTVKIKQIAHLEPSKWYPSLLWIQVNPREELFSSSLTLTGENPHFLILLTPTLA